MIQTVSESAITVKNHIKPTNKRQQTEQKHTDKHREIPGVKCAEADMQRGGGGQHKSLAFSSLLLQQHELLLHTVNGGWELSKTTFASFTEIRS